jgi:hypothetical protein
MQNISQTLHCYAKQHPTESDYVTIIIVKTKIALINVMIYGNGGQKGSFAHPAYTDFQKLCDKFDPTEKQNDDEWELCWAPQH